MASDDFTNRTLKVCGPKWLREQHDIGVEPAMVQDCVLGVSRHVEDLKAGSSMPRFERQLPPSHAACQHYKVAEQTTAYADQGIAQDSGRRRTANAIGKHSAVEMERPHSTHCGHSADEASCLGVHGCVIATDGLR